MKSITFDSLAVRQMQDRLIFAKPFDSLRTTTTRTVSLAKTNAYAMRLKRFTDESLKPTRCSETLLIGQLIGRALIRD
jgi:hypothetical protein